jgi:hypothetical protein
MSNFNLMKVNSSLVPVRDQTLRLATAAVAGPALIYAGVKYPGTWKGKSALIGLGAFLIYTNYSCFRAALDGEEVQEEDAQPEGLSVAI